MSEIIRNVSNFLVPATGSTSAMTIKRQLTASDQLYIDFSEKGLDGSPFRPYGVYVDNTENDTAASVTINEMGFRIVVPARTFLMTPFPAPLNLTATLTGDGVVTFVFVDSPVIPYSIGPSGGGGGGQTDGLTDAQLRASPVPVSGPLTQAELFAYPLDVEGDFLTNTQLRASALQVTGPLTKQQYEETVAPVVITNEMLTLTMNVSRVTNAGTLTANTWEVSFKNVGEADGTVKGVTLKPGEEVRWGPIGSGRRFGNIAYDATGTEFLLTNVTGS